MTKRIETDSAKKNDPAELTMDEPLEGNYGLGGWTPKFLQWINNPKGFLVVMFIAILATTSVSSGLVNINVAPLERRFGLDSTQSGLLVIGVDVGFIIVTLFISYYGMNISRPKLVAMGAALFGLGSLVYSLPHFITDNYNYGAGQLQVTCPLPGQNTSSCFQSENSRGYLGVLLLGTVLMGCGSTSFFTIGVAFLEDSVPKNSGAIYIGIVHAGSVLGPVIGFLAGGKFLLDYFVDFDKGVQAPFSITDPRWVGAWWVVALIAMVVAWVFVIPLVGFPKQLPGTNKIRAARVSEAHDDGGSQMAQNTEFGKSIREFPKAFWIIVRNPVFVWITLATCCQWLYLNGLSAFMAKFVENEFHLSTGKAAMLTGAIMVPAGALGNVFAGTLIARMNWKTPAILKLTIAMLVLMIGLTPISFVHCENKNVAGVTVPYRYPSEMYSGAIMQVNEALQAGNLTAGCNANCSCQEEFFIPVCGDDGKTYFSPCHAGCTGSNFTNNITLPFEYTSCQCVLSPVQKAYPGACTRGCRSLPVYLAIMFFVAMFSFAPVTPSVVMTFRVVPEKMRSFAVGVQSLFVRALGNVPGPLIYGALIDLTCILWQTRQCDGSRGLCWIFNNENMNIAFISISMSINSLAVLLYVIAGCVYKPEYEASIQSRGKLSKMSASENAGYEDTNDRL